MLLQIRVHFMPMRVNDTCPFHAHIRWTPFHAISCHYIHAIFMLIHTTVHFIPIHANDTCLFHAHIRWTQLHATFMLLRSRVHFMLYTQTHNSHSQRACVCAKQLLSVCKIPLGDLSGNVLVTNTMQTDVSLIEVQINEDWAELCSIYYL